MAKSMNAEQKLKYMTETPLSKLILSLSVPTIISMLISSFYNMADTYFVGLIGSASASGAVGVVFPLMSIMQAVGFMFGHGSGNHMSRALGAGRTDDAQAMAATGFVSAFIAGLVIMLVGLTTAEPLVYLLGSTETIAPYAQQYIRYLMPGVPFLISSLVLNNQLRFQGSAFYGMIGISTGAVLNILLDPIFIFVLNMGVAGAALATSISQFVSFVILLLMTRRGANIRIRLRSFNPTLRRFAEIFRGGIPSLARQGLNSLASVCLNLAAGGYGDAAIAAMSIVSRVMQMTVSAIIGFGQGFQPVCGFNYGAKLYGRVRKAFWFCVRLGYVLRASCSVGHLCPADHQSLPGCGSGGSAHWFAGAQAAVHLPAPVLFQLHCQHDAADHGHCGPCNAFGRLASGFVLHSRGAGAGKAAGAFGCADGAGSIRSAFLPVVRPDYPDCAAGSEDT